jgi:hypothetical protein
MVKQLKSACTIGILAFAAMTALPAAAQGTYPSSAQEFSSRFWTEPMMRAMDTNKDGMVSRQEFLTYMGTQYDMMDSGKKGMLTAPQFMDKKMMSRTFMFPSSPSESGPNR